jgi:hypothetical protein
MPVRMVDPAKSSSYQNSFTAVSNGWTSSMSVGTGFPLVIEPEEDRTAWTCDLED